MKISAYLVCYDIADPLRLQKVHRYWKERAMAVQYSVFAGAFTSAALWRHVAGLRDLIDEDEDDVRIYAVPQGARLYLAGITRPDGVTVISVELLGPFLQRVFDRAAPRP